MGKPTPGFTVALLDDDLNEVPAGEEGEIAVRVKPIRPVALFREYWLNPGEMTKQFAAIGILPATVRCGMRTGISGSWPQGRRHQEFGLPHRAVRSRKCAARTSSRSGRGSGRQTG